MSGLLLWMTACLIISGGVLAADDGVPAQVVDSLKKDFPGLKFQEVYPSPISGLYEVVAGNRIVYFAPETGHIIVGDMWNKEGENLSKARIGKLMGEKLKLLPMDKAVKIGSGKNTVVEVTDPDCPFCRKGSEFFADRKDVTRYIFFLPLKMHPTAKQKASYILSAEDPAKAYEEVMSGKYDKTPLPKFTDNGVIEIHQAAAEELGVTGTPNYWVNGTFVAGANVKAIEKLLK